MDALQLLKEAVKEYKASSILRMISRITWEGPKAFGFYGQKADELKLSAFMLSLIAKIAILHTDEAKGKNEASSFRDIARLLNIFHDHLYEKQFEHVKQKSGKITQQDFFSFVIRLTQQQLPYQKKNHLELARTLFLCNDFLKLKSQRVNYEQVFQELYGMNLERFLQISYSICVAYWEGKHKKSEIMHYCRNLSTYKRDEFLCVFDKLSTDKLKFKELTEKRKIDEVLFEYYQFNPLQSYPIFLINDDEIVIPSSYEYHFRITDGIYYDLFNKFFNQKNPKSNLFTEDLGEVFEEYVNTLWGTTNKKWMPEFEYGSGQKFSDFSVLENESLFLIELKAKRLRLPTRVTGSLEELWQDMETGIVEALIQIQKKIDDVKKGVHGLDKYKSAKVFYGIVLILDSMYFGNDTFSREIIERMVNEKGIRLEFQYQVMLIDEFERLMKPFKDEMTWSQLLSKKIENEIVNLPFNSLAQITPLHAAQENTLLNARFEMFYETIKGAISQIVFPI